MKKTKTTVSVIMPAYNGEKYIGEAIESILGQTFTDWELIIIDDASKDQTCSVVSEFLKDSRIRLLKMQKNVGIAQTTNLGLQEANGTYIALLDDDDIALKDRLEVQVKYLDEHPEIGMLGGRTVFVDEHGKFIRYGLETRNNPLYIRAMLLFGSVDFMNSTVMFRRNTIEKYHLSYQDKCFGMQDYRFFIDFSKIGNISSIDRFFVKHRYHEQNTTAVCLKNHTQERKQKYKEFQRYSIEYDGFQLEKSEWELLHSVFAEFNGGCRTKQELSALLKVLDKMNAQCQKKDLAYKNEFEILCKNKILAQIAGMNYKEIGDLMKEDV